MSFDTFMDLVGGAIYALILFSMLAVPVLAGVFLVCLGVAHLLGLA